MKLKDLVEYCTRNKISDDVDLMAFNGDDGEVVEVTGILYDPSTHTIEFCTDDPS
jgi:hypothetical protein